MTENNLTPMFVGIEVKNIRRFIDEEIDTIGRDVLRRTLHKMLDRVCEASDNRGAEYQNQIAKQGEVMAETARRNVRVERENRELRECLRSCINFIGDAAETLGADCDTIEMIQRAKELVK